jgi:hypothetical protein
MSPNLPTANREQPGAQLLGGIDFVDLSQGRLPGAAKMVHPYTDIEKHYED